MQGYDESPFQAIPPVVVVLALAVALPEVAFSLADRGIFGSQRSWQGKSERVDLRVRSARSSFLGWLVLFLPPDPYFSIRLSASSISRLSFRGRAFPPRTNSPKGLSSNLSKASFR